MGITEQGCIEGWDICYFPKFGLRNNTQIWAFFFYAFGVPLSVLCDRKLCQGWQ